LLVLLSFLAAFLLSHMNVKSWFEVLISDATGLKVAVNGGATVSLYPNLHVALTELTLKKGESQLASLSEADIGVALWPLLRKQVRINRLVLRNMSVAVERDRNGDFNFVKPVAAKQLMAVNLGHLSLVKASFRYVNRQSDKEIAAKDCDVEGNNVQLAEGAIADIMEHLTLSAHFVCAEVRNDRYVGTDVSSAVTGARGIFKLASVSMRILGGRGSGLIDADFTGRIPAYRVHYVVTQLPVDELVRSLVSGKVSEGRLDFTADLSMQGRDAMEMTRTAQGEASLRGKNLNIAIGNLDERLSHYESSQNFNLVDIGAFFIAGPLGAAVTKGHDFASNFQDTKGNTEIRVLVSQWKVEKGVAQAQDVAMVTTSNRLAMKGGLDFVREDFNDVTIALLDHDGCARVEQKIHGSFSKPEVQKPNVLVSLTGPVSSLIGKVTKVLGAKCDVFYEGSVQP
jgi:AsmA protein